MVEYPCMKLIVEITYRDDKKRTFECVDFPSTLGSFICLYLDGFGREYVSEGTIDRIKTYFKT